MSLDSWPILSSPSNRLGQVSTLAHVSHHDKLSSALKLRPTESIKPSCLLRMIQPTPSGGNSASLTCYTMYFYTWYSERQALYYPGIQCKGNFSYKCMQRITWRICVWLYLILILSHILYNIYKTAKSQYENTCLTLKQKGYSSWRANQVPVLSTKIQKLRLQFKWAYQLSFLF